ncbi:MAG: diguanylate cyclase [Desulfobacteraceae bacterium]|nr:MAG: diguanylate cyclase [Desulfobacteraceae bacterium]
MIKATILIVDDRPENLLTLEQVLESPELEIIRANSGHEALEKTFDHEFALILLDVQMPDMDGYETAEYLRNNSKTKNIPIIFLTAAQKESHHIFKGYDAGGVDYILKPFEPVVLKSKVGVFLELYRQRQQLELKTRELDARLAELEEARHQLELKNEQLRFLSTRDSLTGLINRRRFDELMDTEWKRGIRNADPVAVILMDIDYFKAYNDCYGHLAGDETLRQVANELSASLHRDVDRVGRYGGEEFIAVLPDTDMEGALKVAERIRENVQALSITHQKSPRYNQVTISVGVSAVIPTPERALDQLIITADNALYRAKENGRNRCESLKME